MKWQEELHTILQKREGIEAFNLKRFDAITKEVIIPTFKEFKKILEEYKIPSELEMNKQPIYYIGFDKELKVEVKLDLDKIIIQIKLEHKSVSYVLDQEIEDILLLEKVITLDEITDDFICKTIIECFDNKYVTSYLRNN